MMKKTINKILSMTLAAVMALSPLTGMFGMSIEAHAAAALPSAATPLLAADTEYEIDDAGNATVLSIKNPETGVFYSIDSEDLFSQETLSQDIKSITLGPDFFTTVESITIGEGIKLSKPNISRTTKYVAFEGNNQVVGDDLTELFADWSALVSVDGFGNVIKSITSGEEVALRKVFSNCSSLEDVDIDLTSYAGKIKFIETFSGCTSLKSLIVTEADITRVNNITGDKGFANNADVQFLSCKFPTATDCDYVLQYAFQKFNGRIYFSNCTTNSDEGFAIKELVSNGNSDNTGSLTVTAENSNIAKIDTLMGSTSYYNTVSLNGLVTEDTTYLKSIFGYHTKCNSVSGIDGWNVSGLKEIYWPFLGLDMENDETEHNTVYTLLNKDITGCLKYNTLGQTYDCDYSDLANVRLNQSADSTYIEGTRTIYIPEYLVTAAQFGGTYMLSHEAWEEINTDDVISYSQVVADAENIPVTETYGSGFNGFRYDNGSLKTSTKYTPAKVSLTVVNVATGTSNTLYYGNNTKVIGCSLINKDVQYYTDEACTVSYDIENGVLTVGNDLTLYFGKVSSPGLEEPSSPIEDLDEGVAIKYPSTFDPNTVTVTLDDGTTTILMSEETVTTIKIDGIEEPAEYNEPEGESDGSMFFDISITIKDANDTTDDGNTVKTLSTALPITFQLPTEYVDGDVTVYNYHDGLAAEPTVVPSTVSDGKVTANTTEYSVYMVKYTLEAEEPVTPPPTVEPDYSVLCNLPRGWSAEFVGDVTDITATLEDGTTRKLGQDGDVITFVASEMDTPDAYNQPTDFASYSRRAFFSTGITVTNGDNTYNVKSIDGSMRIGVFTDLSSLDFYQWKVYEYPEGINKAPVQVPAILSPADTDGDTFIMTTSDCGIFVLLNHGAYSAVDTLTYTIEVAWDDVGFESSRPTSVAGTWVAGEESGTFNIPKDITKYIQTAYVEVPKGNGEPTFTLTDIPGYSLNTTSTSSYVKRFTFTHVEEELEPIVENLPEGVSVTFGVDIEDITATLADGTTRPLGSDETTLIINVEPKNQTVYQSPTGQIFDRILFYDISLVITDGINQWNVKAIDSPMGIAVPIPSDCGAKTNIKVWHYDRGIMLEPTEVTNKSVTNSHIVIPTTSYSYYAVSYNMGDTIQKSLRIDWNDTGYESERPTSVVSDWTATYADGSTLTGTVIFNKDTTASTQTKTFDVLKSNNGSGLVSVTAAIRTVTGYSVVATNDPLLFEMKYVGNQASVVNTTFNFVFQNDTADVRPTSVDFEVTAIYDDGSEDARTITCDIASNGKGTVRVTFPIENADGSSYNMITWSYPEIPGYERVSSGQTATYNYIGGGTAIKTEYPVTVTFAGDSGNTAKRPTNLSVNWTARTIVTHQTTTGTFNIPINTTTNTFTQTVTIPAPGNEARNIVLTAPVIEGYTVDVNGFNIVYTYESTASKTQSMNYELIFSDEDNKAGRRPAELTVTLKDNANSNNKVTSTIKITDPTTTTKDKYYGTFTIPYGTTYVIDSIKGLPEGYKESISGLSATLKYTPETVDKTYKIEWKGDAAELRPSTVTLKVKSGENEGATLTVSSQTNWAAEAKLAKYIKGVEASWKVEAPNVTNYSASVSGEVITYTYTGTLTEAQKEAIGANSDSEKEKEENMYSFEKFDWIDYANRYPDVKKAFGYNKEALYAHYIHYGIAEGRVATFDGKYENVDEEILKAYFPNDYKYKVNHKDSTEQMLEEMGMSPEGSSDKSNVTVDESGNTTIKTENADGTTTETVIDKDGNVVSTKTYATGDMRTEALPGLFVTIIAIAVCIGAISVAEFRKNNKLAKFVNSNIKS